MTTEIKSLGIVLIADGRRRLPNGTILFGSLEVDQTGMIECELRNESGVNVTLDGLSLENGTDFQLVGESGFEFPLTLEPGEGFFFDVSVFSETEAEEIVDYLEVLSSVAGAPLNFRLAATYVDTELGSGSGGGGGSDSGSDGGSDGGGGEISDGLLAFEGEYGGALDSVHNFPISASSTTELKVRFLNVGTGPLTVTDVNFSDPRFTTVGLSLPDVTAADAHTLVTLQADNTNDDLDGFEVVMSVVHNGEGSPRTQVFQANLFQANL